MKRVFAVVNAFLLLAVALSIFAGPTTAQQTQDDNKSVKQDVKDAGHSTKEATKKTGKDVKKGTKKAVNKSAEKTDEGAKKVEDKTAPKP